MGGHVSHPEATGLPMSRGDKSKKGRGKPDYRYNIEHKHQRNKLLWGTSARDTFQHLRGPLPITGGYETLLHHYLIQNQDDCETPSTKALGHFCPSHHQLRMVLMGTRWLRESLSHRGSNMALPRPSGSFRYNWTMARITNQFFNWMFFHYLKI